MDYNAGSGRFQYYNGSSWQTLGAFLPLGACAKNGMIEYDRLLSLLKFCGNAQWRSFRVGITLNICSQAGQWGYNASAGYYQFCNGLLWVRMS